MAVTISLTADASSAEASLRQFQTNITAALSGIDAKMQDTARKTGQATDAWRTSLTSLSQTVLKTHVEQGTLSQALLQTGQAATSQLSSFQKLQQQYKQTEQASTSLAQKTVSTTESFQALATAAAGVFAVFQGGGIIAGFLRDVTLTAARTETLGVVLTQVAKNAGITSQQAATARDTIKALGITTQEASTITTRFIQNNLDLAQATQLARVAQDAAVIANQNSSEALAGLLHGILTLQPEVIRTYGLTVNLEASYAAFAKASGRTTESLTGQEKQQIALNAVLTGATSIAGAYAASLGTVGKLLGSMARFTQEAANVMGSAYLPVTLQVVKVVISLLEAYQALPGPVQIATSAIVASAAAVGTLTVAIAALTRAGQVLAISSLFTGWGPVLIGIGLAVAGVIALTKALADLGNTDPSVVLKRSVDAIDARIKQTEHLLAVQAQANKALIGSGADDPTARIARTQELTAALEGLRKVREQLTTQAPIERKGAVEDWTARQLTALKEAKGIPAELNKQISEINRNLRAAASNIPQLEEALGLFRSDPAFTQKREAFIADQMKARQALQDRLLGIDRKGAAQAAKDAESEAKRLAQLNQQALEDSLKTQVALVAQSFDERRQVIDAKFAEDLAREPLRVKELSAARTAVLQATAVEEARFVEQVQLDSLNRQVLTADEYSAKREAIIKRTGEVELKAGQQTLQQQIKDAEELVSLTDRVNEQILDRDERMQQERTRQLQHELDRQAAAYQAFSGRVISFIDEAFQGLLEGTLNSIQFFKKLLIQQLSSIGANIIGPFIASISSTVLQGVASVVPSGIGSAILQTAGLSGVGGGGAGAGGNSVGLLEGLGFVSSLKTIGGAFTNGLTSLTDAMINAGSTISTFFGGPALGTGFSGVEVGGAIDVGAGSTAGSVIGGLGGAAAMAGGIYAALNATNTASRAAYAASAAAGTAALASTALVAAGVIAASSGWTGIGLIAAAVTAIIGTVLEMVIKPAGPALAVGQVSGLNIGTAGGQLQVQGDLRSRVLRRDKVDPGVASGVQAQLEEGITAAVVSIVQTINAVALDPSALVGPTQDALQKALQNIRPINTANAKKMEKDIEEQLRFSRIAIVAGMLGPLNEAFNQLRDDGSLAEQLDRLPATTAGLVDVFKTMNTQLSEIAGSKNTDVLRQLSGVRSQVELFGARIAETAGQVAERIVDQLVTSLQSTVVPSLAGQITQFSGLMDASLRALSGLRATQQRLEGAGLRGGGVGGQIDRLVEVTALTAERISTEIVSGALQHLSADLNRVLIQPVTVQATTVNGLFTDSLAALNSLWVEWHRLENEGINAGRVREQFDRLVGGLLDSVQRLTEAAFDPENFAAFLGVLLSIPEALSNLNPVTAAVRQVGLAFAQVVAPIQQVIDATKLEMQTPQERASDAAQRMAELGDAIAQTGDKIDQALPLYAQLGQAIQANAQAQIEVVNAAAEEMTRLVQAEYDAMLVIVQTWADQEIQAINDFTDAAAAQYNAYFGAYTDAVNVAFDEQRDAWDRWANDMMAGLEGFIDASTRAVNTWAESANTMAGQLETVNRTIRAEMSPAAQRAELEQRKAVFAAQAAGGGPGADRALSELISINTDLLALAKSSDNLALQQRSIDELRVLQKILQDRLYAATGETDPVLAQIKVGLIQQAALQNIEAYQKQQTEYITQTQQAAVEAIEQRRRDHLDSLEIIRVRVQEGFEAVRAARLDAIEAERTTLEERLAADRDQKLSDVTHWQEETVKAIKVDMVFQLQMIQYELQRMFAMQYKVLTGGDLGQPTAPTLPVAAQLGGLIAQASMNRQMTGPLSFASGGMVPALLEPGERVISGPMTHAQQGALMAINTAVPRFARGGWTVPGHGSGDSVPALVPSGSFVLNRNASRAIGYQQGGMVSRGGPTDQSRHVNIHLNLQGSTFSKNITLDELKSLLETLQRRGLQR